mmetsp:Transcript_46769/g.69176  ORF Transcript_46769/g.69176 Transcript_46769/m.69176 type:complete len:123 (+) Transcript_46769:200-568(+)
MLIGFIYDSYWFFQSVTYQLDLFLLAHTREFIPMYTLEVNSVKNSSKDQNNTLVLVRVLTPPKKIPNYGFEQNPQNYDKLRYVRLRLTISDGIHSHINAHPTRAKSQSFDDKAASALFLFCL